MKQDKTLYVTQIILDHGCGIDVDVSCFLYRNTNKNSYISYVKLNQRSKETQTTFTLPGVVCK